MDMPKRKSNDIAMVWVHPSYRRYLKFEALRKGKSVLEYTREKGLKEEMEDRMREQRESNGFKLNF